MSKKKAVTAGSSTTAPAAGDMEVETSGMPSLAFLLIANSRSDAAAPQAAVPEDEDEG